LDSPRIAARPASPMAWKCMAIIISGPAAKNPAEITGRMRATSPMTIGSDTKAAPIGAAKTVMPA
jgi:hypothetical protein